MSQNPGSFARNRISQSLSGAWRNKLEFRQVFQGIFGKQVDCASQRKSLNRIKLWRSRLMSLTPAGILATLTILEVKLKDESGELNQHDLRVMYSTAIVRFLNSVHSTSRSSKSLYSVAKEVGLSSYIVDLRHSCSHGQTLPSLKTFRQVTSYCLQWLKSFYWEPQLTIMQDAKIEDVRRNNKTAFEKNLRHLFIVYDIISEGLRRKKKLLKDLESTNREFLQWSEKISPWQKLKNLQAQLLESLFAAVSAEQQVREIAQLFTEAFLECDLLIKAAVKERKEEENTVSVTVIHQILFRSIADWAFIPNCLLALMDIAENEQEATERREGAAFWCERFIESFMAFQELKRVYKQNKDADPTVNLDFSSINTDSVDIVLMTAYAEMGIVPETSLIFSDSVRRPWNLRFSRKFLKERALKASSVTVKILENFLQLADPPIDPIEQENLVQIAKQFLSTEESAELPEDSDKIYTLEDVLGAKSSESPEGEMKNYGIWSECPSDVNWATCPLGKLPW
ncbi:uncharacterized protein DMENIID0001_116270 [Sergentomyia squamirostris]